MESNPTTPFIPPMPDLYNGRSHPNSPVRPPVIPLSPPSSQGGPPPPGFPPYNSGGYAPAPVPQYLSPYGSSPGYIPSPMMPGSYYMPNVQLPDARAAPPGGTPRAPPGPPPPGHGPPPSGPPPGFSADWTGYPPPPPPQPHQTPAWGPGPSPWGPPPPQLHPYTAYNTFQQPLPGAYPQQYPGQPQQYPGQPQQYPGQWGPPVGAPYTTPAMGYGGQLPPQVPGWYGGAPPGFGPPPPQAAPAARATRIARADRGDLIGRFAAGPHYGPVLKPMLVHRMRAELFVNPLLLPQEGEGDSERAHLKWNMLFSTAHCQRSTDPPHKSWSAGRQEPATFPHVSHLRLISRTVPWMIDIRATNPTLGVTCGDVVDQLSDYLQMRLRKEDYANARPETQAKLKQAYHENRSPKEGVPGGRLGDGLKRLDWLGPNAMWGGIRRNDSFVKQKCGDVLPCVLELVCLERPAVTQEDREEARRSRRRSRSTRRGSSAANSEGSH